MKKQELIEKLKTTGKVASNVFISVSEVIKMIEELETDSLELSDSVISDIAREIVNELDRKGSEVISDFDLDADIRSNSVEISISDVSFDSYEIECIVESAVEKCIASKEESDNQTSEVYN